MTDGRGRVVRAAPAKLNLFLEVLGRRPDGYHEIDSVFCALDLHDTVTVEKSDAISLSIDGADDVPADETNLAWRAAEAFGAGARIHLQKRIPAGAGLGGGSSDAAAVLLALAEIHGADPAALGDRAVGLGADVPYFLRAGLARGRGIGERVEPVAAPPAGSFLLLLPDLFCSTKEIYGALEPGLTGCNDGATVFLERYLEAGGGAHAPYFNRLQAAAEQVVPQLRMVREDAERRFGLPFTMTGSGSSYFAWVGADPGNTPASWTVENVAVRVVLVRSAPTDST
ncbi:MAG: 4-(cytidine 5'-diphospho)-2-C-methyl-D-erythritol kinase [Planctomycetota bacterium]